LKKLFVIHFFVLTVLFLSACIQKELSFKKIDNIPKKVTEAIILNEQLQVIHSSNKIYYIVFESTEDVKASSETAGTTAIIKLDEVSTDSDVRKYVYTLTIDKYHNTIDIQVNGESMSYPVIILD